MKEKVKKLKEKIFEDELSMVFKEEGGGEVVKIDRPTRNPGASKGLTSVPNKNKELKMESSSSSDEGRDHMKALLKEDSSSFAYKYQSSKRKRKDEDEEEVSDSDESPQQLKQQNTKRLKVEPA